MTAASLSAMLTSTAAPTYNTSSYQYLLQASTATACDTINSPDLCFLPFPNNFWLRKQNSTSGSSTVSVTLQNKTVGNTFDPNTSGLNWADGWSQYMPATAYFGPVDLLASGAATFSNITVSLNQSTSPTILIDTVTGEVVPHWVELDFTAANATQINQTLMQTGFYSSTANTTGLLFPQPIPSVQQMTLLWPAARLNDATRYIVAFRNLMLANGTQAQPSADFTSLILGAAGANSTALSSSLAARLPNYKNIFSTLQTYGWSSTDVVLAWDFTTQTKQNTTGHTVAMRDDAFSRMNNTNITWTIGQVLSGASVNYTNAYKLIQGNFSFPTYLTTQQPGGVLNVTQTGVPVYQGMTNVAFGVMIPQSVSNGSITAPTMQYYAHGLLNDLTEIFDPFLIDQANVYGNILFSVDWLGLSGPYGAYFQGAFGSNLGGLHSSLDLTQQALVNALGCTRMFIQGNIFDDPALYGTNNKTVVPQQMRPLKPSYYGISLGGILGTAYTALSTDIDRAALNVAGGSFALLLPRFIGFQPLYNLLSTAYSSPLQRIQHISFIQAFWNRIDPLAYVPYVTGSETLGNTTRAKAVFMASGLGDAEVTYIGAYTLARSYNASTWSNDVTEPNESGDLYGLTKISTSSTVNVSAGKAFYQTYKFNTVPPVPKINEPPTVYDTHQTSRVLPSYWQQIHTFITNGTVPYTCPAGGCIYDIPSQCSPLGPCPSTNALIPAYG